MNKSVYYFFIATLILLCSCKKSHHSVTCMEDLKDAKIGVITGTPEDFTVSAMYKPEQIYRFSTDFLLPIKQRKVDAFVDESISIPGVNVECPEMKYFEFEGGEVSDIAFAVSSEQVELHKQLSHFIDSLRECHAIDSLKARWETKAGATGKLTCYRSKANGKPIVASVPADTQPYNFIVNNQCSGLEIELLEMFAESIGRTMKYSITDYNSVPVDVSMNRADIGAGLLSVTEEHGKKLLFTTPYTVATPTVFYLPEEYFEQNAGMASLTTNLWNDIKSVFHSNLIAEDRYMLIVNGLYVTAIISILSILLGTLLGSLLCFMKMNRRKWMRLFADAYISIIRGTPILVLLLLMYYVVFSATSLDAILVASITFGINMAAYVCEILRTGIESIDKGQTEAGLTLGFSKTKTFLLIVMPQAISRAMPVYINEVVNIILETSIVGYIAVVDMTKATDVIRSRTFDAFFPLIVTAVLYFFLAWMATKLITLIVKYAKMPSFKTSANESGISKKTYKLPQLSANTDTLIKIEHLAKAYDNGLQVLKDVNAEIKRGDVISVIGPSGTGKSTFLRCLNLLESPTAGSITIDGKNILKPDCDINAMRMRMGMVFQSFNLFEHLTVLENITLAPQKLLGIKAEEAKSQAIDLLHLVGLASKANMYPSQLSGGQKQRIAIARALAMNPEILLFDEPTSALDPTMVSEVLNVIRTLAQKGITMIIVTHEMRFAHDVSTRIFYMDQGVIYEDGTPEQVFDNPQKELTRIFVNRIRESKYHINSHDYDYYEMIGQFEKFCSYHSLSRATKDAIQHCIDEVLIMLQPDQAKTCPDIVFSVAFSERSNEVTMTITSSENIDLHIMDKEENKMSIDIIKSQCRNITVTENKILLELNNITKN